MALASLKKRQTHAKTIVTYLRDTYDTTQCPLTYDNEVQLIVAVILSAQCTDERVNTVTPALFKAYPDAFALAQATQSDMERLVKSTGFFRNKAKNIIACCQQLVELYNGTLPRTLEQLHALPGVGRKTANVVLGHLWNIPGMVVDTHVRRLSNRLGLTNLQDAVKIEFALMELLPKEEWHQLSMGMILHGRAVCKARKPACHRCALAAHCPSALVRSTAEKGEL